MRIHFRLAGLLGLALICLPVAVCASAAEQPPAATGQAATQEEQTAEDFTAVEVPGDDLSFGPPPVELTLRTQNGRTEIMADPNVFLIENEGRMEWVVTGAQEGDEITIVFSQNNNRDFLERDSGKSDGPFPPSEGSARGRYSRTGSGNIETQPADVSRSFWKYTVVWKRGDIYVKEDPWGVVD